jgi:periplasmic protein TonB
VGRVYPPAAASRALDARVQLDCVADGAGRLESCAVASEEPAGSGFGAAALKLRTIYAMRPLLADGRSVAGGRVRVEVTFGYAELHRLGFVSPARND